MNPATDHRKETYWKGERDGSLLLNGSKSGWGKTARVAPVFGNLAVGEQKSTAGGTSDPELSRSEENRNNRLDSHALENRDSGHIRSWNNQGTPEVEGTQSRGSRWLRMEDFLGGRVYGGWLCCGWAWRRESWRGGVSRWHSLRALSCRGRGREKRKTPLSNVDGGWRATRAEKDAMTAGCLGCLWELYGGYPRTVFLARRQLLERRRATIVRLFFLPLRTEHSADPNLIILYAARSGRESCRERAGARLFGGRCLGASRRIPPQLGNIDYGRGWVFI